MDSKISDSFGYAVTVTHLSSLFLSWAGNTVSFFINSVVKRKICHLPSLLFSNYLNGSNRNYMPLVTILISVGGKNYILLAEQVQCSSDITFLKVLILTGTHMSING
jgi:hypothetical protein